MMYKESDFIALIITLSILNFAGKGNDVNVLLDWDSWVKRDLPPEMYVARPQIFFSFHESLKVSQKPRTQKDRFEFLPFKFVTREFS